MPIYEYQCEACGHKLEKLQKISDEPLRDCPSCEDSKLKKLVSAAAFRLKGGGWYETDFKTGKKKNVSGGDKSSASDNSSKKTSSDKTSSNKQGSAEKSSSSAASN